MKSQVRINKEIATKIRSIIAGKERFEFCEQIFSERKKEVVPPMIDVSKIKATHKILARQPFKDTLYYVIRKGKTKSQRKGGRIRFYLRKKTFTKSESKEV